MATPKGRKVEFILALFLPLFLYGAYFYHLLRQEYLLMLQKQGALEAVKAVAVPGTAFLNGLGNLAVLKSSLFYLILLGMMLLVFVLFSLFFYSLWKRGVFLGLGLLAALVLTFNDRINVFFPLVTCLALSSFFLLTLSIKIHFSFKELCVLLLWMIFISGSLLYGSKHAFFLKARDRVLFDSPLGNRLISFYYTYSPLATSLISPKSGVYGGLIYYAEMKNTETLYLDKGMFISGSTEAEGSADYIISKNDGQMFIKSREGRSSPIQSLGTAQVIMSSKQLFSMKGLLLLSKFGLYFFPAGLLIMCLVAVKGLTTQPRVFILSTTIIASLILLFIWGVILTGNETPNINQLQDTALDQEGLSIAYYLYDKREIPAPFIPMIKKMAQSESTALRYWGATHLGALGDPKVGVTLLALLDDPSPNVRTKAAFSLFKVLKQESYSPLALRLFTDPNWYVRCRIFSLFIRAGVIPSPA